MTAEVASFGRKVIKGVTNFFKSTEKPETEEEWATEFRNLFLVNPEDPSALDSVTKRLEVLNLSARSQLPIGLFMETPSPFDSPGISTYIRALVVANHFGLQGTEDKVFNKESESS